MTSVAQVSLRTLFVFGRVLAALYCAFLLFAFAFVGRLDGPSATVIGGAVLALGGFVALPRSYFYDSSNRVVLLGFAAFALIASTLKILFDGNFELVALLPWIVQAGLLAVMAVEILLFVKMRGASAV